MKAQNTDIAQIASGAESVRPSKLRALPGLCLAAGLAVGLTAAHGQFQSGTYDWSTHPVDTAITVFEDDGDPNTTPPGPDNWQERGNWDAVAVDAQVVDSATPPTGFSGNFLEFEGGENPAQGAIRGNDSNFSYNIPTSADSVTLSVVMETNSDNQNFSVALRDSGVGRSYAWGQRGFTDWSVSDKDNNVRLFTPSGDGVITSSSSSYRLTLEWDRSVGTMDYIVDNLDTPAGPETIASGIPIGNTTLSGSDVSGFDALQLNRRDDSLQPNQVQTTVRLDEISIVPEPSAYALIGGFLALGAVMLRRRCG